MATDSAKELLKQIVPCDMNRPYIFVSYASQDWQAVYADVIEFQRRGYNIWIDEPNLDKSKPSWKDDALTAIHDLYCRLLVFYISDHSLTSSGCANEMFATTDELSRRRHNGPVKFITVELERIDDLPAYVNELYQRILNSGSSMAERNTRAENLSILFDEYFSSNNEKVRIHPKDEQGRKLDYYEDIVSTFPEMCYNEDLQKRIEQDQRHRAEQEQKRLAAEEQRRWEEEQRSREEEQRRLTEDEQKPRETVTKPDPVLSPDLAPQPAVPSKAAVWLDTLKRDKRKGLIGIAGIAAACLAIFLLFGGMNKKTPVPAVSEEPAQAVSAAEEQVVSTAMLLNGVEVNAADYLTYTDLTDSTIQITGLVQDAVLEGDLVLPGEIDGKTVTAIGDEAFFNCNGLTEVVLPEGLTKIGKLAFSTNRKLSGITIPNSVTEIGPGALTNCKSLTRIQLAPGNSSYTLRDGVLLTKNEEVLLCYPAGLSKTSYIIPENVRLISDYAFFGCGNLTSIVFSNKVNEIGYEAFSNCKGLIKLTIPSEVQKISAEAFSYCESLVNVTLPTKLNEIGDKAFYSCYKLTNLTIPDSVTTIGQKAFSDCDSLTSVIIPEKVQTIGAKAFAYCGELTRVTIPDSVTEIGDGAFSICLKLAQFQVKSGNEYYAAQDGILYKKNGNTLETLVCCPAKTALTSYTVPDGVKKIAYSAFYYCIGLSSITLPDSVTRIEDAAFGFCRELTGITIPDAVTHIGGRAFTNCNKLTGVTVPAGVTELGEAAFSFCNSLEKIEVAAGNKKYCVQDGILYEKNGDALEKLLLCPAKHPITEYTVPNTVKVISEDAFCNAALTGISIPAGVEKIEKEAFIYTLKLKELQLAPDNKNYQLIDGALFTKDGTQLICYPVASTQTSYTIPSGITSIPASAFYFAHSLTSVVIPDSVTTIETYAFHGCNNLTSVTIPESVTNIAAEAFTKCTQLTDVTISKNCTLGDKAFPDTCTVSYY